MNVDDLGDARLRELHSVRIRRAARRRSDVATGSKRSVPSISIVLATNRPVDLDQAIACIQQQSITPAQVLVGLHGEQWNGEHEARIIDAFGDSADVVRCDGLLNLGEVLNVLSGRATTDLVTKWDDDDWYGRHHLEDLIDALTYSGADLVGKAAEFVRLEQIDLTVRRFEVGAESYSTTLAGGTLLLRRTMLESVGGWAPEPRHVDRLLIDAIRSKGGVVYRTHGFEYLLRRRAAQHTWAAEDGYFLAHASEVRAGLDLAFCGIDA